MGAYALHLARMASFSWTNVLWFDLPWGVGLVACLLVLVFAALVSLDSWIRR